MKVLIAREIVKYHGGDLKILAGASLAVEAGEKIGWSAATAPARPRS
jgi:hypothetical protein